MSYVFVGLTTLMVMLSFTNAWAQEAVENPTKHSMAGWCLTAPPWEWSLAEICQMAEGLGIESVELVPPEDWPTLEKHGLICALAPNDLPGLFVRGLNNPRYHREVVASTKRMIDSCAEFGFPNVIAFTGYKWRVVENPSRGEIPLAEGADNCVETLKELAPYAEEKGVTICLEMLNTRDDSHPMKGHPGYQGDDLDYVAEIVERVDHPNVRLLFDVYHVQVMNGDVIRRIRQWGHLIGHVHTAGNPGRGELGADQEINYPAVAAALREVGYKGWFGHEFIPTKDPFEGFKEAVALCD